MWFILKGIQELIFCVWFVWYLCLLKGCGKDWLTSLDYVEHCSLSYICSIHVTLQDWIYLDIFIFFFAFWMLVAPFGIESGIFQMLNLRRPFEKFVDWWQCWYASSSQQRRTAASPRTFQTDLVRPNRLISRMQETAIHGIAQNNVSKHLLIKYIYTLLEVFTALQIHVVVFWVVTLCSYSCGLLSQ
jgi:hypothetical protein